MTTSFLVLDESLRLFDDHLGHLHVALRQLSNVEDTTSPRTTIAACR